MKSLDICRGFLLYKEDGVNKIQRNAKTYTRLIDTEYIFYLGYKGKCQKIILHFPIENFQHLEGIGQLKDLVFHQSKGADVFYKALQGEITEDELKKSLEYESNYTERKIDHLYLLEEFIDNNEVVFNYIKHKVKGSKIQAKIFLYKDMNGQDIYLFLDSSNDDEFYYPRSFVVAPDLNYRQGQYKYTVLWKEKRNRKTGISEVLWRFKDFSPENIN